AIRLNPKKGYHYYLRAAAYHNLGKHEESLADFAMAVRLSPDDAEIRSWRKLAFAEQRKWDAALMDWLAEIWFEESEPGDSGVNLATCWQAQSEFYELFGDLLPKIFDDVPVVPQPLVRGMAESVRT